MALNSSARWPLSTDPDMQIFQWTVIQSIWLGPMHQTDLGFTRLPYKPIVLLYSFGAGNDADGDDEEGWWWWWSGWCNRNTYRSKQNWVPAHDFVDSKIVHETPWEFVRWRYVFHSCFSSLSWGQQACDYLRVPSLPPLSCIFPSSSSSSSTSSSCLFSSWLSPDVSCVILLLWDRNQVRHLLDGAGVGSRNNLLSTASGFWALRIELWSYILTGTQFRSREIISTKHLPTQPNVPKGQ